MRELGAVGKGVQMISQGKGAAGEFEVGKLGEWDLQKAGRESCGFPDELAEAWHGAEE